MNCAFNYYYILIIGIILGMCYQCHQPLQKLLLVKLNSLQTEISHIKSFKNF